MTKQNKQTIQILFLLFLLAGSVYVILEARKPVPYRKYEGKIFGTSFHITYQSRNNLEHGILQSLQEVDHSLSMFNPLSTISLINTNRSNATDPLFREVFNRAMDVARQSGGAFDITVAPLVNAWGFGFRNKEHINSHVIDSLRTFVGYQLVSMKQQRIYKADSRVMLDCSGIAKGYGCDRVALFLRKNGVKNYMIEIGGEICTAGLNDKGEIWTIGIVRPLDDNQTVDNTLQSILQISNIAIATSGNYRNFYYQGKRKYAHTIDPHTGYPVQHSILSSTVLAPTCTEADAYATAFMVLGIDSSQKVLSHHSELQAYFIYADNKGKYKIWSSQTLRKNILK